MRASFYLRACANRHHAHNRTAQTARGGVEAFAHLTNRSIKPSLVVRAALVNGLKRAHLEWLRQHHASARLGFQSGSGHVFSSQPANESAMFCFVDVLLQLSNLRIQPGALNVALLDHSVIDSNERLGKTIETLGVFTHCRLVEF